MAAKKRTPTIVSSQKSVEFMQLAWERGYDCGMGGGIKTIQTITDRRDRDITHIVRDLITVPTTKKRGK